MYTLHTLVLSPIGNQMREAYANEHIAKPGGRPTPSQEQEVPKNKEKMSE